MSVDQQIAKFKAQWKEVEKTVLQRTNEILEHVVLEFFNRVRERTPIGAPHTWKSPPSKDYVPGALYQSWHIKRGQMGSIGKDGGRKYKWVQKYNTSVGDKSAEANIAQGGVNFEISGDGKQVYTLYNTRPYAQRIEDGWSGQAPQGMVKVTASEFPMIVERMGKKYSNIG